MNTIGNNSTNTFWVDDPSIMNIFKLCPSRGASSNKEDIFKKHEKKINEMFDKINKQIQNQK